MKQANITLRRARVRAKINGSASRPRLSVHVSSKHVSAQLIDDQSSVTLAYATSVGQKSLKGKTMIEKATWCGEQIGTRAKELKIKEAIFDRGERIYHGRVAAIADAARKAGLKF